MPILEYAGEPERRPANAPAWPEPRTPREQLLAPRGYRPEKGLIDAVNVALLLEQPLLVTGEPGTGKTQLAYSLAWELGLEPPLAYETKSTSTARDLFYNYDAVGHFRAGQADALGFLSWNALGEAILRSKPDAEGERWRATGFAPSGPRRSVVLIDEIDKAPRDFPNDLLNEVERLFFRIPELGNVRVDADPTLRPLLILTSNSEKNLPDAFLRRCAYYHIEFPGEEKLKEIVLERVGSFAGGDAPMMKEAFAFFALLRNKQKRQWEKVPATAELINWLAVLRHKGADPQRPLRDQTRLLEESLSALIKNRDDQNYVAALIRDGKW